MKMVCLVHKIDGRRSVMRIDRSSGKQVAILMHRLITKAPPGMVVDHINHDGLDNRRCNLQVCTHQENMWNQRRTDEQTRQAAEYLKTLKDILPRPAKLVP
jgi:hypothetical protein